MKPTPGEYFFVAGVLLAAAKDFNQVGTRLSKLANAENKKQLDCETLITPEYGERFEVSPGLSD